MTELGKQCVQAVAVIITHHTFWHRLSVHVAQDLSRQVRLVLSLMDSTLICKPYRHAIGIQTCHAAPAGIDRSRVEDMENRLKQDVLQEAAQYNNQILVAHENDDFQVVEQWEAVTEVDVQTPLEVYRELSGKGSIIHELDACPSSNGTWQT